MKKFNLAAILLFLGISLPISVSALQPINIDDQKAVNENAAIQLKNNGGAIDYLTKLDILSQRYYADLRTCEPLHFNQYIDFFGFKLNFNFDINGWVNNKCEYKISGKITSLGKDIREVYNVKISDEQIAKIQPVVLCNFDKAQLDILTDALISRNQKNSEVFEKMVGSPEKKLNITKNKLTPQEEKLLKMVTDGKTCTIPNKDELMQQFIDITNPESL
ncbi:hypothetical protein IJ541_11530 [bacterium]|nr:hypothetical protein [bacterium]